MSKLVKSACPPTRSQQLPLFAWPPERVTLDGGMFVLTFDDNPPDSESLLAQFDWDACLGMNRSGSDQIGAPWLLTQLVGPRPALVAINPGTTSVARHSGGQTMEPGQPAIAGAA